MEELAGRALAGFVDRPVVDGTGLAGRFDVRLEFVRELPRQALLNGVPMTESPAAGPDAPPIFAALLDQLGLRLSPQKAPIDVIVVDSASKPSEN